MALGQAIPDPAPARHAELVAMLREEVNRIVGYATEYVSCAETDREAEHLTDKILAILDRPAPAIIAIIDRCFALCSCKEDSDGPCAVCDYLIGVRKDAIDRPAPEPVEARPRIVCLCGSTRFMGAFQQANFDETIAGRIVLSIGCNAKSDHELFNGPEGEEIKRRLDELHKRKIDLADEVLILNVGGYTGESTLSELAYAINNKKQIRFLEPVPEPARDYPAQGEHLSTEDFDEC